MTGWYLERTPGRPATAVIAATLLALVGGSVLAAGLAVAVAGASGLRHLRKLAAGPSFPLVALDDSQYTDAEEPGGGDYTDVVQLDRSEYTEVR